MIPNFDEFLNALPKQVEENVVKILDEPTAYALQKGLKYIGKKLSPSTYDMLKDISEKIGLGTPNRKPLTYGRIRTILRCFMDYFKEKRHSNRYGAYAVYGRRSLLVSENLLWVLYWKVRYFEFTHQQSIDAMKVSIDAAFGDKITTPTFWSTRQQKDNFATTKQVIQQVVQLQVASPVVPSPVVMAPPVVIAPSVVVSPPPALPIKPKVKETINIGDIFPVGSEGKQRLVQYLQKWENGQRNHKHPDIVRIINIVNLALEVGAKVYEAKKPRRYLAIEIENEVWLLNVIPLLEYDIQGSPKKGKGDGNAVFIGPAHIQGEHWIPFVKKHSRTDLKRTKAYGFTAYNRNNQKSLTKELARLTKLLKTQRIVA